MLPPGRWMFSLRWCGRRDVRASSNSLSGTAVDGAGFMTSRVSAGRCGRCGPSVSGGARTRAAMRTTFTEEHELAGARAKLTARAIAWATDGLQRFDTSVFALAYQLGVSWHTAWDDIRTEAARNSLPGSKQLRWIRSAATRTRSATNCPKLSPFCMPSMW